MHTKTSQSKTTSLFIITALIVLLIPRIASATTMTAGSDTVTRSKVSTAADHELHFELTADTLAPNDNILITFDGSFTLDTFSYADVSIFKYGNTSNCATATFTTIPVAATATSSDAGAAYNGGFGGVAITMPTSGSTISAGVCIVIGIDGYVTNPSSAGSYDVTINSLPDAGSITGPESVIESITLPLAIVTDDQVVVSATVANTLTFSIAGGNSLDLGTLSTTNLNHTSNTITVANNASSYVSGYNLYYTATPLWVSGNHAQLIAAYDGSTPASTGVEGWGMNVVANTNLNSSSFGSNVSAGQSTNAAPGSGYGTNGTYKAITSDPGTPTYDKLAGSTGPGQDIWTVSYVAMQSSSTTPGTYTTTVTYNVFGNF